MSIIPNGLPTISAGSHDPYSGQACAMEYISVLAGEKWSDTPECTDKVLGAITMQVNDALPDKDRARVMVPLIGRLMGTNITAQPIGTQVYIYLAMASSARRFVSRYMPSGCEGYAAAQMVLCYEARAQTQQELSPDSPEVMASCETALRAFANWGFYENHLNQVLSIVLDAFERNAATFKAVSVSKAEVTVEQLVGLDLTKAVSA